MDFPFLTSAPVDTLTLFSAEELLSPGFLLSQPQETSYFSNFFCYLSIGRRDWELSLEGICMGRLFFSTDELF